MKRDWLITLTKPVGMRILQSTIDIIDSIPMTHDNEVIGTNDDISVGKKIGGWLATIPHSPRFSSLSSMFVI